MMEVAPALSQQLLKSVTTITVLPLLEQLAFLCCCISSYIFQDLLRILSS